MTSEQELKDSLTKQFDHTKSFNDSLTKATEIIKSEITKKYKSKLKGFRFVKLFYDPIKILESQIDSFDLSERQECALFKQYIDYDYKIQIDKYNKSLLEHFQMLVKEALKSVNNIPLSIVTTHSPYITFTKLTISHGTNLRKTKEAYDFLAKEYGVHLVENDTEFTAIQLTSNFEKLINKISADCAIDTFYIRDHFTTIGKQTNLKLININFAGLFGKKLMDMMIDNYIINKYYVKK
jgi:hypothetical protein